MTEFAEGGYQEWGTNGVWDTDETMMVDLNFSPPYGTPPLTRDFTF